MCPSVNARRPATLWLLANDSWVPEDELIQHLPIAYSVSTRRCIGCDFRETRQSCGCGSCASTNLLALGAAKKMSRLKGRLMDTHKGVENALVILLVLPRVGCEHQGHTGATQGKWIGRVQDSVLFTEALVSVSHPVLLIVWAIGLRLRFRWGDLDRQRDWKVSSNYRGFTRFQAGQKRRR